MRARNSPPCDQKRARSGRGGQGRSAGGRGAPGTARHGGSTCGPRMRRGPQPGPPGAQRGRFWSPTGVCAREIPRLATKSGRGRARAESGGRGAPGGERRVGSAGHGAARRVDMRPADATGPAAGTPWAPARPVLVANRGMRARDSPPCDQKRARAGRGGVRAGVTAPLRRPRPGRARRRAPGAARRSQRAGAHAARAGTRPRWHRRGRCALRHPARSPSG